MTAEDADGEPPAGPAGDGRVPEEWDPVRAWLFLRASRTYRAAWKGRKPHPGLPEAAPFPVRLQTAADLAARRFGLHAWENPYAKDGPLAPFWAGAATPDGRVAPGGAPLAELAAAVDAGLSGLRLADGALILRIEQDGRSMQLRIGGGARFPRDGGLLIVREVLRIEDIWSGVPAPRSGRVRGTGIASCWLSWKGTRRAVRTATSQRRSGAPSASPRNTTPTAGCTLVSSAA